MRTKLDKIYLNPPPFFSPFVYECENANVIIHATLWSELQCIHASIFVSMFGQIHALKCPFHELTNHANEKQQPKKVDQHDRFNWSANQSCLVIPLNCCY